MRLQDLRPLALSHLTAMWQVVCKYRNRTCADGLQDRCSTMKHTCCGWDALSCGTRIRDCGECAPGGAQEPTFAGTTFIPTPVRRATFVSRQILQFSTPKTKRPQAGDAWGLYWRFTQEGCRSRPPDDGMRLYKTLSNSHAPARGATSVVAPAVPLHSTAGRLPAELRERCWLRMWKFMACSLSQHVGRYQYFCRKFLGKNDGTVFTPVGAGPRSRAVPGVPGPGGRHPATRRTPRPGRPGACWPAGPWAGASSMDGGAVCPVGVWHASTGMSGCIPTRQGGQQPAGGVRMHMHRRIIGLIPTSCQRSPCPVDGWPSRHAASGAAVRLLVAMGLLRPGGIAAVRDRCAEV